MIRSLRSQVPIVTLIGLALALAAGPARAADYRLALDATYVAGVGSYDVKVADLNQDGKPDIVAAIADGTKVVVLLNDGTGHFPTVSSYPVGTAVALNIGDYDGDGKPDVVDTDYSEGTISLRLNLGGGILGAATTTAMGVQPRDVVGADFDGDGDRDVAVATGSGILWVRAGHGPGGLTGLPHQFNVGGILKGIDAGDFDNDGKVDLMLVDAQLNRAIPMHNDGNFQFSARPPIAMGGGPSDVVLRDLDGDGWLDVAVANEDGRATVSRNNQNGTFAASVPFPIGNLSQSIAVADFNNDGRPDLLCSNYTENTVSILHGQGGMLFGDRLDGVSAGGLRGAAPGDFNGDGRVDVVTGDFNAGTLHVLRNVPTGPIMIVDTPVLDFGTGFVGVMQTLQAQFRNSGDATLTVSPELLDGPEFQLVGPLAPVNVAPNATVSFSIRYERNTIGAASDVFRVTSNDTLLPEAEISLTGFAGEPPIVGVSGPAPMVLATGTQASAHVVVRSLGNTPLHVTIPTFATDLTETCPQDIGMLALPISRYDGLVALWDITGNGSVGHGTTGEYAGGMLLTNFPAQAQAMLGLAERETRIGPVAVPSGVLVTRKQFVSGNAMFARFVDVAENTGSVAKMATIDIIDNLGYTPFGAIRTSSGDDQFTVIDDWIVAPPDDGPGRRSVARVLRTAGAPHSPNTANYNSVAHSSRTTFSITVPPYGRVCVIQWGIQGTDANDAEARASALALAPEAALEDLDAIDRSTSWNVTPGPAVFQPAAGALVIAPGDSALVEIVYDAGSATHTATIHGTLRITTDDVSNPLVIVPLELQVNGPVVGVEPGGPGGVAGLSLAGFMPNPARVGGSARIGYALASSEPATITLYDLRGRILARRVLEHPAPGPGSIELAGIGSGRLAPGVVWVRLVQGGRIAARKGIVLP
jgi:hypothetical protein